VFVEAFHADLLGLEQDGFDVAFCAADAGDVELFLDAQAPFDDAYVLVPGWPVRSALETYTLSRVKPDASNSSIALWASLRLSKTATRVCCMMRPPVIVTWVSWRRVRRSVPR
jgi:hypothetical protein